MRKQLAQIEKDKLDEANQQRESLDEKAKKIKVLTEQNIQLTTEKYYFEG